jgi:T-complex protein 1 subunit theta
MGSMGMPYGLQSMLKEGHKHFSGINEATMKNIEACKGLSQITRTSMGPNGAFTFALSGRRVLARWAAAAWSAARGAREEGKKERPLCSLSLLTDRPQKITEFTPLLHPPSRNPRKTSTGMNKMVINHLDKLFVTSDASTIVTELEVFHPAAKLLVAAARAQAAEVGDGTNLVLSLAGELLAKAEGMLRDGLVPAEIAEGYTRACAKALEALEKAVFAGSAELDVRDAASVAARLRASVASKQLGSERVLCPLIARACIDVCPKNPANFNVDNVRIVKIMGGGLPDSTVVPGLVLRRDAEGTVKRVTDAKVAVYAQGIDTAGPETKGTVLIRSGEELEKYAQGEEDALEKCVKAVADAGVKLVVAGSSVGEMAMHFLEKYGIMVLRVPSKFDLRRVCRATGSVALVKLTAEPPSAEEIGFVKQASVREIGGANCVVLEQQEGGAGGGADGGSGGDKDNDQDNKVGPSTGGSGVATIVLRGATEGFLDDVERAVDDGVNAFKSLCKDARAVPAGGGSEVAAALAVAAHARALTGLDQYSVAAFAEALEVVPRTLAENSGCPDPDGVVGQLKALHAAGHSGAGVDVEAAGGGSGAGDALLSACAADLRAARGVEDLFSVKWWALKLATDAVVTVLRVDQIIMAKQAGGPKPRGGMGDDD